MFGTVITYSNFYIYDTCSVSPIVHMVQNGSMFKDRSRTVQFSSFLSARRPFHPKINGKLKKSCKFLNSKFTKIRLDQKSDIQIISFM